MPYVRILTLAICLVFVGDTYGSQPRITKSSLSSLLQQPTVSAIFRDRTGILWIGTQQGLHRFDGANLTIYDSAKSNQNWIPDSVIMHIAEDSDGSLLVGTAGGFLLKMNSHSEVFDAFKLPGPEGKTSLIKFLVSRSGDIWVLSKDGLNEFDAQLQRPQGRITNLNLESSVGQLRDFVEDNAGNLWVAGSFGLVEVDLKQRSLRSIDIESLKLPRDSKLTALKVNSQGHLVVGTNIGGLLVWDIAAKGVLTRATLLGDTSKYISDLEEFGEMLLIATDRGIFASDHTLSSLYNLGEKGDGLSNSDVYSLLQDGAHTWVGTADGLNILSLTPFDIFNSKNSAVSNDILAFEEDKFGRIWVGTFDGLYRYDEANEEHTRIKLGMDSSTGQRVATLFASGTELWVGLLRGGLHIVNTEDAHMPSLTLMDGITDLDVTKILGDNNRSNAWIATYRQGLYRIAAKTNYPYNQMQTMPETTITLLFMQKNQKLMAVSENRAYQHSQSTDKFQKIEFDFSLGKVNPKIYSIAQASNNDLFLGTKDYGLFVWPHESQIRNQFKLASLNQGGLESSTIYGIEPDSNGNLWCSTQKGIVKLDTKGRIIRRFTKADGLQGDDFALGASFTSSKGLIYFGGANGYNRFDPDEVPVDSPQSPMILTKISLPKQEIRILHALAEIETLQLNHTDHFVTFQFSVLDFVSLEKNQFRYKLENFDTDWVENGTRNIATYTNLPAGDYVLRVQGANSAGIWNRDGITLAVRVLPAPWLSWWAYSTYVMGALFLVWSSHRIYRSYAIDRKSTQMAVEMFEAANRADDEMQEQLELQDAVIQSAFQHRVTTLSLVSDLISYRGSKESDNQIRDLTESGIKRIAALSMLEDCLYYEDGASVVDLHKYTENVLPLLLKSSSVPPETIVTINEITSILLSTEIGTPLSIVIYELLENCVQHAFELESSANYIHLKLSFSHDSNPSLSSLELIIQDSGIGLPDTIENLILGNSGIGIVQNILQKMGGMMQCSIGKGTTISITLPQPNASYKYSDQPNPA